MELAIILRIVAALGLAIWFAVWLYHRGWWDWALPNKWRRRKKVIHHEIDSGQDGEEIHQESSDLNIGFRYEEIDRQPPET